MKPLVFLISLLVALPASASAAVVAYTYDNAGRLVGADFGNGRTITYAYDANGNLLQREVRVRPPQEYFLDVEVSPAGYVTVTGDRINCPVDCAEGYEEGAEVRLTAEAAAGMKFLQWQGSLAGPANPDSLTMDADKSVSAFFGAQNGDTDTDGVPDAVESGPSGDNPAYDGDASGTWDYQEPGAASLETAAGGAYATLAVPAGSGLVLKEVHAMVNPSPGNAPADVAFPYGFFTFRVSDMDADGCTDRKSNLPFATFVEFVFTRFFVAFFADAFGSVETAVHNFVRVFLDCLHYAH